MTRENQGRKGKQVAKVPSSQESPATPETPHTPDPIDDIETIKTSFDTPIKPPSKRVKTLQYDEYVSGTEFTTPQKAGVKFTIAYLEDRGERAVPFNKRMFFALEGCPMLQDIEF